MASVIIVVASRGALENKDVVAIFSVEGQHWGVEARLWAARFVRDHVGGCQCPVLQISALIQSKSSPGVTTHLAVANSVWIMGFVGAGVRTRPIIIII